MSTTRTRPGILYAEDFSDTGIGTARSPERVAQTIADDAQRMARQEGFAAGLDAAHADQAATALMLRQSCLQGIADELARQRVSRLAIVETRAQEIADVLSAMLAACLPAFCAQRGDGETQALICAIIPGLTPAAVLKLRVAPGCEADLAGDIAALDHLEQAPSIDVDHHLRPGDVKMTWENGHAVRDTAATIAAVQKALAAAGLFCDQKEHQP